MDSQDEASMQATGAEMVAFLNEAWTAYHAVAAVKRRLRAAGFVEILERDAWSLAPGGKYFYTRNQSAIVAFAVGGKYVRGNGITSIGAHTDSPCPKLKPNPHKEAAGYVQIGLQTYGGGLWHTWFDRDLGIAGRVIVRRPGGKLSHELVKIDRPILRIPNLAIHLETAEERAAFKVNKETHLPAVLASSFKAQLGGAAAAAAPAAAATEEGEPEPKRQQVGPKGGSSRAAKQQPTLLLSLLSEELQCAPADIADLELQLCPVEPSAIGGARREFIFSGRLDNLASCFCATKALVACAEESSLAAEANVRMIALFDHEEVGSCSAHGAGSTIMPEAIKRIALALGGGEGGEGGEGGAAAVGDREGLVERVIRRSFLVSADMAHGVHPNYAAKHEANHGPAIHGGQVIKQNANQRYATDAVSAFLFRELGEKAGCPVQEFVVRSDCGCGSTIGPMLSALTGIKTVDVGAPMLSMHSIREMCGVDDVTYTVEHFKAVFEGFVALEASLQVDGADAE